MSPEELARLLRGFLQHPVLLLVVLAWAGSGVAKLFKALKAEAARKAAREKQSGQRPASEDDIAERLRRLMGQEQTQQREVARQDEAERHQEDAERELEIEQRREAEQQLAMERQREAQRQLEAERRAHDRSGHRDRTPTRRRAGAERDRDQPREAAPAHLRGYPQHKVADAVASVSGPTALSALTAAPRLKTKAFVIGDVRHAIIASEILGPPLSLRP